MSSDRRLPASGAVANTGRLTSQRYTILSRDEGGAASDLEARTAQSLALSDECPAAPLFFPDGNHLPLLGINSDIQRYWKRGLELRPMPDS